MLFRITQNILARQSLNLLKNPLLYAPAYSFAKKTFAYKKQSKSQENVFNQAQTIIDSAKQSQIDNQTTFSEIMLHKGINSFVTKVYATSGASIFGALATAYYVSLNSYNMTSNFTISLLTLIGGIIGFSFSKPQYFQEVKNGQIVYKSKNSIFRLFCYSAVYFGVGYSFAPIMQYANFLNSSIIPTAMIITGAVFGASTLYAMLKKSDSLLTWKNSLYGSLSGLIVLQLTGLLSTFLFGPNPYSLIVNRADTFFGVGLFSAFIAYDTQKAVSMYKEGQPDHLGASMQIALDVWNVFIRVVQILMVFQKND